jgi:Tol biopolymer transport system component
MRRRHLVVITLAILSACILLSSRSAPAGATSGANAKIAFESQRDGNSEIYVMRADGSAQTRLTSDASPDRLPVWSPDGTQIAYEHGTGADQEIFLISALGGAPTNLTNSAGLDFLPRWSPDGSRIAFMSERDGNYEIYIMNADGSGQTNLTNHLSTDGGQAWSPDGTKIAFQTQRDGNNEIYVMNDDGSAPAPLSNNVARDLWPEWSPDGTAIAFASARHDSDPQGCLYQLCNFEIYVMNADGSNQTRLTDHFLGDRVPRWSPDGSKVLWVRGWEGNDNALTMNADGTNQTPLATNSTLAGLDWTWSGTQIVLAGNFDGDFDLFLSSPAGGALSPLTVNTAADQSPAGLQLSGVGGLAAAPDMVRKETGSTWLAALAIAALAAAALTSVVLAATRR